MNEKEPKTEVGRIEPKKEEKLATVSAGQSVILDGEEYIFDAAAAQEYNEWVNWVAQGLYDEKEALKRIELTTAAGKKKSFVPQKIKNALKNK